MSSDNMETQGEVVVRRRRGSKNVPPLMSERLELVVCGSDAALKSYISDIILGQRRVSPESSSECVRRDGEVCGCLISLVEIPALYNTQLSEEEVMQETLRCVFLCDPGVHAFLLIIPEGPLTDEDRSEMQKIQMVFSSKLNEHAIVLITTESQQETVHLDEVTRTFTEACRGGHYLFGPVPDVSGLIDRVKQLLFMNNGDLYTPLNYLQGHLRRYNTQITEMKTTIQALERKIQSHSEGVSGCALRIVLLGRTGAGKSTTGNTILRRQDTFRHRMSHKSVTTECQKETAEVNGRQITVIDTPGLFDTQVSHVEIQKEIRKCVFMAAPGPHVFLLVLKVGQRFSEEEKQAVKMIQKMFGEQSVMFTIVLFTGGDLLKVSIEEYLGEPGSDVMKLIEQCGHRYHIFNNKESRDHSQVTDLLQKIDSMLTVNGGSFYTNEMFQQVEKEVQEERERALKNRLEEAEREKEELKEEIEDMKKSLQEEIDSERKRREDEFKKREKRVRREMADKEEQCRIDGERREEEYERRRKDDEKRREREERVRREWDERQRKEREEYKHKIEEIKRKPQNEQRRRAEEEKKTVERFKEKEHQPTTRHEEEMENRKKISEEERETMEASPKVETENKRVRKEREEQLRREDEENQEVDPRLEPVHKLFSKLGLNVKPDKKLTTSHFFDITPNFTHNKKPVEEKDVVQAFMQRLLTTNYRARHINIKTKLTEPQLEEMENTFGLLYRITIDQMYNQHIHPMDIQMAVFLCADHFLRQMIVHKLSQCQYAVPLLVPNPFSGDIEFPLWAMRQIRKSWRTSDLSYNKREEMSIVSVDTPMVAFFRLGAVSTSKSQLMNSLINEKHNTFFHRNCPGSRRDRLLMDGVVEIAWYLPSGKNTDHFTDCVAFCNLHGDSSANATQRKILTEMASVNVILLPKADENDNMVIIKELCSSPTPLIVLLTDDDDDVSEIGKRKYKVGLKGRNQSNISSTLRSVIRNCLSHESLTFRLENVAKYTELLLDENDETCQKAKASAQKVMRFLEKEDPSTIKDKYLPCHGKLWIDWCNKDKDLRHLQSNNIEVEQCIKQKEMRELRIQQQKHGVSDVMNSFIESLNSQSDTEKLYFIKWISTLLDDFTSEKLFTIQQEYDKKWKQVWELKSTQLSLTGVKADQLKAEQSNLEKISSKLNAATFGLEHILREMGQIYEASASTKRELQRNQNRNLSYLPGLAADLMISGHPMELMDGDAAHVPLIWISAVLDELINKLGDQRVFVLSVLGIQSSGKSTMLNAMFGLQFAVSAGRCTRGALMQLVKVSEEMKKVLNTDYILVVDTEGLGALELTGKDRRRHDNELATFVVGLGNVTLINMFGENPAEMQDILQIVVQAFMRTKKVKLNPSCMFVHQNVGYFTVEQMNMEGRRRLQEKLDQMTQLAAKEEGCVAERFSDVIAFDVQNDVRYFSQLWEGCPPMAPPNPNYSDCVQELKDAILKKSQRISYKLSEFKTRLDDLWNAVLRECF